MLDRGTSSEAELLPWLDINCNTDAVFIHPHYLPMHFKILWPYLHLVVANVVKLRGHDWTEGPYGAFNRDSSYLLRAGCLNVVLGNQILSDTAWAGWPKDDLWRSLLISAIMWMCELVKILCHCANLFLLHSPNCTHHRTYASPCAELQLMSLSAWRSLSSCWNFHNVVIYCKNPGRCFPHTASALCNQTKRKTQKKHTKVFNFFFFPMNKLCEKRTQEATFCKLCLGAGVFKVRSCCSGSCLVKFCIWKDRDSPASLGHLSLSWMRCSLVLSWNFTCCDLWLLLPKQSLHTLEESHPWLLCVPLGT